MLGAVRLARHLSLGADDNVVTIATDGFDRYPSVLTDLESRRGHSGCGRVRRSVSRWHSWKTSWTYAVGAKQRLFGCKDQVWSAFHYSHAYLQGMQSQHFWDAEFEKVEAIDRALHWRAGK